MKSISYTKAAIAAAALALGASAAQATVYGYGTIGDDFFEVQPVEVESAGLFFDYHAFRVTEPMYSFGSLTNVNTGPLGKSITGLSVKLYAGNVDPLTNSVIGTAVLLDDLVDNPGSIAGVHYTGEGYYPVTIGSTTYTDYFFEVSGTAGANGGRYTFIAATAPVPEPETYAMLMAGLGVMGAIAVRRKKAKHD